VYLFKIYNKNFKSETTSIFFILVPPEMPVILSGKGKVITGHDLGPFEVGADLEVICQVAGGKKKTKYLFK
jgi:hypothetical protein